MIKKLIKKFKKVFTQKSKPILKSVDPHNLGGRQNIQSSYIGVSAPVFLMDDPWFGSAPKTEKVIQHEEKIAAENKIKEEQQRKFNKESENIHQMMYEIATKNWTTVAQSQGGSENFQEGPNGWCSGNGYNQFRG